MEEPEKNLLQLGKGGMDDPSGGAPPRRTPPLFFFLCILLKFGSIFQPSPEALVAAI